MVVRNHYGSAVIGIQRAEEFSRLGAEWLGRLSGETHNLMNQLAKKMTTARAETRPTNSAKLRRTRDKSE
jgi:hypothetical protein